MLNRLRCRFVQLRVRNIDCLCHPGHSCHSAKIQACPQCYLEKQCPHINNNGTSVAEVCRLEQYGEELTDEALGLCG